MRIPHVARPLRVHPFTAIAIGTLGLLIAACGSAGRGAASNPVATTAPAATSAARSAATPAPAIPTAIVAAPTAIASATPAPAGTSTATPAVAGTATATPAPTSAPATPTAAATAAIPSATPDAASFASSDNTWTDAVGAAAIPVGDGRVSTTPRAGYLESCTTAFRGGGAEHDGPWIDAGSGTWNATTKLAVLGEQTWPSAFYHASVQGPTRVVTFDAVPVGLPTGLFPIRRTDPAYQYDRNPNAIVARSLTYRLPAHPAAATTPSCTRLGPIGVTTAGVVLFNALDDAGHDAGAHEVQDACQGHPNGQEVYHYHSISSCLAHGQPSTSMLVGYALDGYGIYAEWNAAGHLPTNADLDACHGRTSSIVWDGQRTTMFHYDVTLEYPYTVGCYHGTPIPVPGGP